MHLHFCKSEKTISSFAADLREKFAITSESSNGNYFRGAYHYKSQEVLDKIALYVISILPQNKESELYKYQKIFILFQKQY